MFERNVTIYLGTKKRLAKRYTVEEPAFSTKSAARVRFMEKGARTRWWVAEARSVVILDGWDHPEFDFLIRGFQDAPIQHLAEGVTYRTISKTYGPGEPEKDRYELEFEAYLSAIDPAKILLNARPKDEAA